MLLQPQHCGSGWKYTVRTLCTYELLSKNVILLKTQSYTEHVAILLHVFTKQHWFQCKYINTHYILQCILVITVSSCACLILFSIIYHFTRIFCCVLYQFTVDAVILTVICVSSIQQYIWNNYTNNFCLAICFFVILSGSSSII